VQVTSFQEREEAYNRALNFASLRLPNPKTDIPIMMRAADAARAEWDKWWSADAALDVWESHYPGLCEHLEARDWHDRDRFDARTDEPDWLILDWLQAGRTCLFVGPGDAGKSRLVAQLLYGFCTDRRTWLPESPEAMELEPSAERAILATWEDDHEEIERKLTLAGNPGLMGDRLLVRDMSRVGPVWDTGWTPAAMQLRLDVEERSARLLVCDPLAAAYAGNENDRAAVRGFMSALDGWARDSGCAVLLVAHPSKAHQDFSGSTDWWGAPRSVWQLSPQPIHDDGKKSALAPCLRLMKSNSRRRSVEPVWLGHAPWKAVQRERAAELWERWRIGG